MSGGSSHPVITSVTFSGCCSGLKMVITGSGFGPAPPGIPGYNDLIYFAFDDWSRFSTPYNYDWQAGFHGNDVILNYISWTDTEIVIDGFSGAYGSLGWTVNPGAAVGIIVLPTTGGGISGPQAAFGAQLP